MGGVVAWKSVPRGSSRARSNSPKKVASRRCRLRDVAARTQMWPSERLYRRFRSKEDLLVAALEIETGRPRANGFGSVRRTGEPRRSSASISLLRGQRRTACARRPNLTRACLKAAASGEAPSRHSSVACLSPIAWRSIVDRRASRTSSTISRQRAMSGARDRGRELGLARAISISFGSHRLVRWSGGHPRRECSVIEQMEELRSYHFPRTLEARRTHDPEDRVKRILYAKDIPADEISNESEERRTRKEESRPTSGIEIGPPEVGPDRVNEAMIRHWCDALDDQQSRLYGCRCRGEVSAWRRSSRRRPCCRRGFYRA